MISKTDILNRAAEWKMRPDVVEKDYVLGWLLAAIAQHPIASTTWVFKGGTCLKKCYFETYRFSEDLDFSLVPSAPYDELALLAILREIAELTHELSGILFAPERTVMKPRRDKLGRSTFQGKLAYRGPLVVPTWPTILFDLTQHEPILAPTSSRRVSHAYGDGLPERTVTTYSLEELLAEKTRALFERTRPRDLYDVMP